MGVALRGQPLPGVGQGLRSEGVRPQVKRLGIQRLGAEVVVTDHPGYDETEAQAQAVAVESGSTFISPFDDPFVAAGNGATLGEEILAGVGGLARIVAPIGGGGLMAGLSAIRDRKAPEVELIGGRVGSVSVDARLHRKGKGARTLRGKAPPGAEGLEGGVSPSTFEICRKALRSVELVSEEEIGDAIRFCREVLGERVEGSAAVTVAYAPKPDVRCPNRTGDLRRKPRRAPPVTRCRWRRSAHTSSGLGQITACVR